MHNTADITTIRLSKQTKKHLDELGKKGQTYEQIIAGLIPKEIKNEDA